MNQKEKVFSNSFILVVMGQIISLFGNGILRFALPFHLLHVTNSPALYGMVSALAFIPIILITPIGGIIADRVNKRNVMVCLDFSVAVIMTVFSLLNGKVNIVGLLLAVLILLYGIAGAYQPSVQASIPLLVKEEGIVTANSVINIISSLAGLLSPIIGGICYSYAGLKPILIISIICFLASAIMEIFIHMDSVPKTDDKVNPFKIAIDDMKESAVYVKNEQPVIIRVVAMCALFNMFLSSFLMIGLPTVITQILDISSTQSSAMMGYMEAGMALGGLVGGILSNYFSQKVPIKNLYLFLIYAGLFMIPMGLSFVFRLPSMLCFIIMLICCFIIMALATIFTIIAIAYIQKNVPMNMVGKIISCCMAVCNCAQPIGQALYGLLLEYASIHIGLIMICVGLLSALSALLFADGLRQDCERVSTVL